MTKTILVVGATSGIGLETSKLLSQNGDRVVLVSRNKEHLESVKSALNSSKVTHLVYGFDATQTSCAEKLICDICSEISIDGLVYCVGNGDSRKIRDLSYEVLLPIMNSNFFTFMEMVRALIKMRKNKEKQLNIVAVSSLASTHANPKYYSAYTASKSALEGAIRVLAPELALKNCAITSVKPGYVNTPRISADMLIHPDLERYLKQSGFQPCGIIPPETVALFIKFLLDRTDMSFSGANIPINSGAIS